MKKFYQIYIFVFLLFSAVSVVAQDGVVVHSDPRLSLLLKKNHTATATKTDNHKTSQQEANANVMAVHAAAGMSAPHPGDMAIHTSNTKPVSANKTEPLMASASKMAAYKYSGADDRPAADNAIHPAEGLTAPHPGDMVIRTSVNKPALPVKTAPLVWAPKHHVRTIYSGKGYRVQIYNGTDRAKAMDIKNEFSRNNPGVRTYLSYISPRFRVKVGNYRNRSDAEGMWREANSTYNPSMIVPDIITITTIE